jgi:hypothetical protein
VKENLVWIFQTSNVCDIKIFSSAKRLDATDSAGIDPVTRESLDVAHSWGWLNYSRNSVQPVTLIIFIRGIIPMSTFNSASAIIEPVDVIGSLCRYRHHMSYNSHLVYVNNSLPPRTRAQTWFNSVLSSIHSASVCAWVAFNSCFTVMGRNEWAVAFYKLAIQSVTFRGVEEITYFNCSGTPLCTSTIRWSSCHKSSTSTSTIFNWRSLLRVPPPSKLEQHVHWLIFLVWKRRSSAVTDACVTRLRRGLMSLLAKTM